MVLYNKKSFGHQILSRDTGVEKKLSEMPIHTDRERSFCLTLTKEFSLREKEEMARHIYKGHVYNVAFAECELNSCLICLS